jgi:HK97 family phage portal protein
MGVIERVQRWMARGAAKAAAPPIFPEWMRYSFSTPTFSALAREGYKGNGAVFGCISALAFAFPEPPLLVWQESAGGQTPLKAHALSKLLKRPNPQMGGAELLQYTIVYMAVGGNCYWLKVRSKAGRVVELWPLHDGQITPVPGKTKLIERYDLDTGEGTLTPIAESDIVHHRWMPDPLAPHKGLAPLVAVAREVDTDNEATRYLFALLKNDAMPRLGLVVPPGVELSDEKFRRLQNQWTDNHADEKRGGVAVLEGGLDIKTIATNLKDLEFNALRRVPEARIAAAFRVPAIIAQLYVGMEKSTYNNSSEARLQFTEDTLVPMWRAVSDEATMDLLPDFAGKDDEVVEFDTGRVIALQTRVKEKRSWALDGLKSGGLMLNEFRSACDLPQDADGDVYLWPLSMVAVPGAIKNPAGRKMHLSPATAKMLSVKERRRDQAQIIEMQRAERRLVGNRMEVDLDRYFADLADRVVRRARGKGLGGRDQGSGSGENGEGSGDQGAGSGERGSGGRDRGEVKEGLPTAGKLLSDADSAELGEILKRFTIELIQLSWGTWNAALGVDAAFDMNDPAVTELLANAGKRIKEISDTTLQAVRELLQHASDNGWSIDHLVRGGDGVRGLRDVVIETYKGRAQTIARTELGNAQNRAAYNRYLAAGLAKVYVLDDGIGDEDEPCVAANQSVHPIAWMAENPLEHPNCTRAFAPEFD